jgi:hypothetical protein
MSRFSIAVAVVAVCAGRLALSGAGQDPPPPPGVESYSPLGFYDLRAYEQAFPEAPGHPAVLRASAAKYWIYRGVAYRGFTAGGAVWTSLGPETSLQHPDTGSSENVSGRVAALLVSPTCEIAGPCRVWVAAAGGGVWRTDDALNTEDAGWRWVGQGLGTNSIGSLALDPNDPTGHTIFVGTGETNTPHNSGAGTGLYRSTGSSIRWCRRRPSTSRSRAGSAPSSSSRATRR